MVCLSMQLDKRNNAGVNYWKGGDVKINLNFK